VILRSKRQELKGGWGKLHNEKLNHLQPVILGYATAGGKADGISIVNYR
jgi:hypothetical protein